MTADLPGTTPRSRPSQQAYTYGTEHGLVVKCSLVPFKREAEQALEASELRQLFIPANSQPSAKLKPVSVRAA